MGQIFVPTVGLNQQQAISQPTAQVNAQIPNQLNPLNDLKGFFKIADTAENRLNTLDQMQMQAEAQNLRDDLQQQLSANRDQLLQKKGKAALDFRKEYEDLNTKSYQDVSNKIQDYRIRNVVKNEFDHTLAGYQTSANSYLSQQTAQLALDQAKASVKNASGNLVDQTVSGTPEQKKAAQTQLDTDTDHLTYLTGGDPNGVDGKVARQEAHDEVAKGIVNHYIDHDAFNAGDAYLASIEKNLTSATRLALQDDLYLARKKYAGFSGSGGTLGGLPNQVAWVKSTAQDLFNSGMAAATDEQRNDPNFVSALRSNSVAKAMNSYAEMQKRTKAFEDLNTATDLSASDAYAYAQKTGTVFGTGEQIANEVLDDPTNILGRLPKELQNNYLQRFKDVDKANEYLATAILPPDGLLGGYTAYKDYLANPEKLRAKYQNIRALRLGLLSDGMGIPYISKLTDVYNKAGKDYDSKQNTNIINSSMKAPSFHDGIFADDKKVKTDPKLQELEFFVSNRAQYHLQRLREASPHATDAELIPLLTNELDNDQSIKNEFVQSALIDQKIDNLRAFNEQLSKYSKPFLDAVKAFLPNEFATALSQDVYEGIRQIDNLATLCLKNDNFKKQHSTLEEVMNADSYINWAKAQQQEQSPFASDLASSLTAEEYKKLQSAKAEPTDGRDQRR